MTRWVLTAAFLLGAAQAADKNALFLAAKNSAPRGECELPEGMDFDKSFMLKVVKANYACLGYLNPEHYDRDFYAILVAPSVIPPGIVGKIPDRYKNDLKVFAKLGPVGEASPEFYRKFMSGRNILRYAERYGVEALDKFKERFDYLNPAESGEEPNNANLIDDAIAQENLWPQLAKMARKRASKPGAP